MPKVTRKETEGPLKEVVVPLAAGDASTSAFPPLSAKDQNEKKIEFRRVSRALLVHSSNSTHSSPEPRGFGILDPREPRDLEHPGPEC